MNTSVGITGGADGLTSIFIFGDTKPLFIGIVALVAVVIAVKLYRKMKVSSSAESV